MSLVRPMVDNRRISRKMTINIDQCIINVRPVIKGAIKEASHTLTEAYGNDAILNWCVRGMQHKHDEFLYTLFKNMINAATLQSRDFAIQVEGCKGVLVWTNNPQGCPWPRALSVAQLARFIGWGSALHILMKFQPSCDKTRRKVMASYPRYITIGYIGVLPHEQRKGLGGALLQHVLDKADASHYPVVVEASTPAGVRFFEKYGFEVQANVYLSRSELPMAIMVREPVTNDAPQPLRIKPGRQNSNGSM
ncbi:uncharacterized protein BYT42DRAFT_594968 [Radiomyces spectabilis]|uniref:uncharacterized protein n=1 Tax=Radiomyces spectabilis TaxID=64574 RepID=UPI002220A439|nr:uncharacterized protein BYT42DRAFT_594968 [Radiomyces spectabilis]KAI8371403.1 hypothetical protein BYT42DRAFT_594968 [Radiomyces spectabilis]